MAKTSLKVNKSYEGETIEEKINRIINNKEPITDGAPLIYTEREEGVKPQHDIRTDRWEIGIEKMDYVTRSAIATRENKILERKEAKKTPEQKAAEATEAAAKNNNKDGGAESVQGTK